MNSKILIVEDELRLASLMTLALTRVGCDVEVVSTGKKAMELAAEKQFDLITLDIELPDASGYDLCSKLKERHISRNTPIIFISARLWPGDIEEGKRRGAVDFIIKPFDVTDFIYRVIFCAKVQVSQELDRRTGIEVIST